MVGQGTIPTTSYPSEHSTVCNQRSMSLDDGEFPQRRTPKKRITAHSKTARNTPHWQD